MAAGTTGGIDSSALGASYDAALDAQGLSSGAVQAGLLKGKVVSLQHELARVRKDLKDTSERLSSTTAKLNEQKMQAGSLTVKYSDLLQKLSDAEANQKSLEEALIAEQRALQQQREAADRAAEQHRRDEAALRHEAQQLESRLGKAQMELAAKESSRTSIDAVAREVAVADERRIRQCDLLLQSFNEALDRLVEAQDADEATIFVARSAAQSAAAEMEGRLLSLQSQVEVLQGAFREYSEGLEKESQSLAISLMSENKELWGHFSKAQFELDQCRADLANKNRRLEEAQSGALFKDQITFLSAQTATLEDKLHKCHDTIDAQVAKEREHEAFVKQLLEDMRVMELRLADVAEEKLTAQRNGADLERQLQDALAKVRYAQQDADDTHRSNAHLTQHVTSLNDQLRHFEETILNEQRQTIRQLTNERDAAVGEADRFRSDALDMQSRITSLERDVDQRTALFEQYKASLEDAHSGYTRTLQEELARHSAMYDREIADIRRELQEKVDESLSLTRALEEERTERHALKTQARILEESLSQARNEAQAIAASSGRFEERQRSLATDAESLRHTLSITDGRRIEAEAQAARSRQQNEQLEQMIAAERTQHEQRITRMETMYKESEKQRTIVVEELRRVRSTSVDEQSLKAMKERADRDREQMAAENERLQAQFADSQQRMSALNTQIAQLKQRLGTAASLQLTIEDQQRKLVEVPELTERIESLQKDLQRAIDEAALLRAERDQLDAKVAFFVEESKNAAKKDLDLDRLFREASMQVRRLDQQIDEVNSVARARPSPLSRDTSPRPPGAPVGPGTIPGRVPPSPAVASSAPAYTAGGRR